MVTNLCILILIVRYCRLARLKFYIYVRIVLRLIQSSPTEYGIPKNWSTVNLLLEQICLLREALPIHNQPIDYMTVSYYCILMSCLY